ncbi:Yip1 family protein [Asticcacaulis taihuensis]|uniref:Yip1 domain-containing protein n=1 Tax=Asticcacaulis taihuensis TaxID=260084 RepID=A0A1G4SR10_9CAUL|nr:Yip1 family protein [Asticcacaulis taihuensis]SCW71516.1 Yip1 domain-containing protein [Asticcacaulis taihuensis]
MTDDSVPPVQAPDPNPYANPKNPNNLIERVQAILLKPSPTWDVIERETPTVQQLYTSYIMPLAAIGPIASAIGGVVFGIGAFGISYHTPLLMAIVGAILSYVLSLIMIYVVALVIDGLAPSFNGQKNFIQALKLAAYASTAGWVASIFGLFPMLGILTLLGALYGIYLFYLGLPKLMKNPADKTVVYMIVVAIVYIVLAMIIGAVAGAVTSAGMMATGGMGHMGGFAFNNHAIVAPNVSKMEEAANQMEAAANQMAAQASAAQTGQSVVKLADASALLALLPPSYNGAARTDDNTSSGGAGGIAVSTAKGTYHIGDGTVNVTVTDMGTVAGIGAMAAAMNLNSSSSSATGYEKVTTENGRMVTEKWDNAAKHGEYAIVSDGRISVAAEGDNVDMGTLKAVVASVDVGRAKALTQ